MNTIKKYKYIFAYSYNLYIIYTNNSIIIVHKNIVYYNP